MTCPPLLPGMLCLLAAVSAACGGQAPDDLGKAPPAAPAAAAPATDWPGWLGPKGDGTSTETGLLKSWPAAGPKVLWKIATGDSYAAPVIARGRLVHVHRNGAEDVIDCLDPATGKSFWRYAVATRYRDQYGAGDGPRGTPLIAGEAVHALMPDGRLHTVKLADGSLLWSRDLKADYSVPDNFFGVGGSPVIGQGVLMINIGGADGAGIVGLDPATGKTLWKATRDAAGYSTPVLATFGDKPAAVFLTRNGPVILDPKTGTVLHAARFRAAIAASVNAATPVVAGDLIFFTSSYGTGELLLKHGAGTFTEVRKGTELASQFATPIHHEGRLFGFDGRYDGQSALVCVDLLSGKCLWRNGDIDKGSLIRADGLWYVRSGGRLLLADLTPAGCKVLAECTPLEGHGYAPPALSDGRLFIRDGRTLMALEVKAGR